MYVYLGVYRLGVCRLGGYRVGEYRLGELSQFYVNHVSVARYFRSRYHVTEPHLALLTSGLAPETSVSGVDDVSKSRILLLM